MIKNISRHGRLLISVFSFLLAFSSILGSLPTRILATEPVNRGVEVGTIDGNKVIGPKNQFDQMIIGGIQARLGATVSYIEINGIRDSRKVLGFADIDKQADRGWYYVYSPSPSDSYKDFDEALYWIQRFNGNSAHILGGNSNVYSRTVSNITNPSMNPYQAYNLAELATASGGAGYTIGDNLQPNGNGYISVGHFRTTPAPTGQVSTNKTAYQVNEQVTISANATDYSYYDRGILVWNLSVINKTTGKGYYAFETNREIADQSGYLPPVNETSSPKPFPWSQTYQYKPTEAGVYEVSLTITDRHHRARQGSPSMSTSTPYTSQFTVGDVPTDPGPDPDPDPPASCKRTTMDLRLEQENSSKEMSGVVSGGEGISVKDDTRIIATAKKAGTFKHNGMVMQSGSGNNRKVGITDAPASGTFTITYESDDGTECWQKTFQVRKGGEEEKDHCPIVIRSGTALKNGVTIEVAPNEEVTLIAKYTDAEGDQLAAKVKWDVIRPDGSIERLPGGYSDEKGRERWATWESDRLTLPFGTGKDSHDVILEKGKTYRVKLNYTGLLWEGRPECDWEITIKVRDSSCTITEQAKIKFKVYGEPPSEFPSGGAPLYDFMFDPFYKETFTKTADGYDMHMAVSANTAGTWYLEYEGRKVPIGQKRMADERQDVLLPDDFAVGEEMKLVFISETGCVREFSFTVLTYKRCYELLISMETVFGDQKWMRSVERGETIELGTSDFGNDGYALNLFTSEDTNYQVRWLDPDTGAWEYRRGSTNLPGSSKASEGHWLRLPQDKDTKEILSGLYIVEFYDDDNSTNQCDGHLFIRIGDAAPKGENLLIIKSSFAISPKQPQAAGTAGTITFQVKNAGSEEHDTKLAVRWESSPQETMLDVDRFKPGEVRTIQVPTQYPQQAENFIANINPGKNKPDNETIWTDNRAMWPVKLNGAPAIPDPPGGGGEFDGGEIGLEIYDSDNRQLQKLSLQADGVWEREPATIRVVIDQSKINEGFQKTQQEINSKISEYKSALEQSVSGEGIQNVTVTAQPGWISDAKSMAVYSPQQLDLKVSGPGTAQQWQVSSASTGGDYLYTGTVVPTQTTWREELQSQKYKAEINGFVISMDYSIQFELAYDSCSTGDDGEETCEPQSQSKTMSGRYTITVKGGERLFEVFEPNATGSLRHTSEWSEYHARDRYPNSQPLDYYAGERILTQVELQARHRHPVSGQYPVVVAAQAWISETGKRQTALQSSLSLKATSPQLWRGPTYSVSKLGERETGVDIPLMGDKQRGFQKDSTYTVHYFVQFRFGASKGFPTFNKSARQGHGPGDYRIAFRIIANAWERQGIRNHTTQ